jgi:hypothetical protein
MKALLERLTLGIQARLVILVLATVLPLVGLASFAMIRAVNNERTRIERDAKERVADLLANVDRQIISIQAELCVLAVSPSLKSGDFAAFDRQMRDALKIQGTSIVLHDIKAQQLLRTNRSYGEQLPRATNSEMHDRVVQTGKPQISDLIVGAVLRRPILTVGVPVFIDGKVAYVLAMGVGPEILSALLNEQNLPPGWNAGIFDRNGLIVAHNMISAGLSANPRRRACARRFRKASKVGFRASPRKGFQCTLLFGAHRSAGGQWRSGCRANSSTRPFTEPNGLSLAAV